jgi:hypothetical protein
VIATVPFDWKFGHLYYLLTARIDVDVWAGWIFDWDSKVWTHIASQSEPGIGRMLPTSSTSVDYDPDLAPSPAADTSTCAFYPRLDAFWHPPTGWRGQVMTTATLGASTESPGECPSTTTTSDGWQYHALGAAG